MHRCSALLVLAAFAASPSISAALQAGPGAHSDALPNSTPEITRAEIEHHVRFLASDELRGRFTGTEEAARAARYLAAALRAAGVEPAGDDGTFLQRVPFERVRAKQAPELAVVLTTGAPFTAEFGADFDLPAGVDAATEGLRVVVVHNEGELPATPDAHAALFVDGNLGERRRILGDSGGRAWGLRVAPGRTKRGTAKSTSPEWSRASAPRGAGDAWLTLNGDLLEHARAGRIASLKLTTHFEHETLPTYNVVGVLRGEGPLAKETVVLSAHYDHLHAQDDGETTSPEAGGPKDVIYNGADDDASGCATVLELAGAFGAAPRPARTLVFLLATGEEIGLVGTNYYLDHPVRPLADTVANLNFEMLGRPDEKIGGPGKLWLTGFELTNLGAACAGAKLDVALDPRPEQHFFERSDNIAFVQRGIVGQTFSTYNLHTDYHRVSDEADTLDYAHMETCARTARAAVALVAEGQLRPAWLEGKAPGTGRGSRRAKDGAK